MYCFLTSKRKGKSMPKQKPTKGLVKRVRVTKNGKIMARGAGSAHRRSVKTPKQLRRLKKTRPIEATAAKQIRQGLGLI